MNRSEFIEFVCERREGCSASSAKTHWYTLLRVYKKYKNKPDLKILPKTSSWINDKVMNIVKEQKSRTQQRNTLSTIVVFLRITKAPKKKLNKFSEEMYSSVKDIRKDLRENGNRRTERQEKLWVPQEKLEAFFEEVTEEALTILKQRHLSRRDEQKVRDAIIVAIHAGKQPPPRNDWATATFEKGPGDGEDHDTRVFKSRNQWYVAIYGKTKRSRGQSKIPLKKPLSTLIQKFIKKRRLEHGDRLLLTNRDTKYSHQSYGAHVRKMFKVKFGVPVGTSMLRVLFISNKYKQLPKILKELELDADEMMHSSETSREHYLKDL